MIEWGSQSWGSHNLAGGVSEGTVGATCMLLTKNQVKNARKSVIALQEAIICVGTSIDTSACIHPVTTCVNQCLLNGPVLVLDTQGKTHSVTAETPLSLGTAWVGSISHDGFVYNFPTSEQQSVDVTVENRSGQWSTIGTGTGTASNAVLCIWVNHPKGSTSSYHYSVCAASANELTKTEQYRLLDNIEKAHIVYFLDGLKAVGTVYQPTEDLWINLADHVSVNSTEQISLIAEVIGNHLKLTCSDPNQSLTKVEFGLSFGSLTRSPTDKPMVLKTISIALPIGDSKGQSVTNIFALE